MNKPLPHEQRAMKEKGELDVKIAKLNSFINSNAIQALPEDERNRLGNQVEAMLVYSRILGNRIAAFSPNNGVYDEDAKMELESCPCIDMQLRAQCLDFALRMHQYTHYIDVVAAAEAFEKFIKGPNKEEAQ